MDQFEKIPTRFESEPPWDIESDIRLGPELEDAVKERLVRAGWEETEAYAVAEAITETFQNAIIHGNFGIEREDFANEEEYKKAREAALDDPRKDSMKVSVELKVTPDRVEAAIADEGGKTIDISKIMDPGLDKATSRGLYIMREVFSEIHTSPGKVVLIRDRGAGEALIK